MWVKQNVVLQVSSIVFLCDGTCATSNRKLMTFENSSLCLRKILMLQAFAFAQNLSNVTMQPSFFTSPIKLQQVKNYFTQHFSWNRIAIQNNFVIVFLNQLLSCKIMDSVQRRMCSNAINDCYFISTKLIKTISPKCPQTLTSVLKD